ncbi:L,D-transpeptidase family protein [Clostridium rhizosphaerae]|uniref:L,D-transpeptidase family protein n=1 Tax=Clostridium rhizosphaerae TaxID=2803861 RepID=UPI003B845AAC
MRKKRIRRNKTGRRIAVFLSLIFAVYLGISIFFTKHLYLGSQINGINVSGKTVTAVKVQLLSELKGYTLNLKERGGKSEQIKAEAIGLKYNSDEEIQNFKDEQHPLKWAASLFNKKSYEITSGIEYNKEALKEQVDKLSAFDNSNIIEPKNSILKYTDNTYMLVDEIKGNKINKDILLKRIEEAILKQETTIDLESSGCYINPQYTSKSQKVTDARDMLNKYISTKITYAFGEHKEILDGSTINKWLSADDNFNVNIDEKKVKAYVESIANTYNTVGKKRSFNTSSGNTINIGGGDYGWKIDINKETNNLIAAIKSGQTITKEPEYVQKASSHGSSDIGNTYVEIDMTKQHLWFYKNGSLVVEGDVVTGNTSLNNTTPGGIYRLKYKEKNATLKGEDYSTPVSYWMPFNGNIGIHDATWRSVFGGEIYKTSGSHGCVNSPYPLAQTIYENINAGTPVVCYY